MSVTMKEVELALGTFFKIPVYEAWEWKPKKGELVMVSQDGKKWSAEFFYKYVGYDYPDRPYQCAQIMNVGESKTLFDCIYAWKYIAKPEDILNAK